MTLRRLDGTTVRSSSVLGKSNDPRCYPNLYHVAICESDQAALAENDPCPVWHCGYPVQQITAGFQFVGYLESLTASEASRIQTAGPMLEAQMQACGLTGEDQYIISPAVKEERDPVTNRLRSIRANCVGFVLICYRQAEIELIDDRSLPPISFDELKRHNPRVRRLSDLERANLGIPGDGPWPVCLAGHVMRAFDRTDNEIRSSFAPSDLSEAHLS